MSQTQLCNSNCTALQRQAGARSHPLELRAARRGIRRGIRRHCETSCSTAQERSTAPAASCSVCRRRVLLSSFAAFLWPQTCDPVVSLPPRPCGHFAGTSLCTSATWRRSTDQTISRHRAGRQRRSRGAPSATGRRPALPPQRMMLLPGARITSYYLGKLQRRLCVFCGARTARC